jgi:hypothetical protein
VTREAETKQYYDTLAKLQGYVVHKIPGIPVILSYKIARNTLRELRTICRWELKRLKDNKDTK